MTLGKLKLENFTALTKAGSMYNQVQQLMLALGKNPEVGRLIGKANIDRVLVQYNEETRVLDIGVCNERMPEYWAGIRFRDEGVPLCHLLISVGIRGDFSALRSSLPKRLAGMKEMPAPDVDPSRESRHVDFARKYDSTWFNCFKPLDLTGEAQPLEVLRWFEDILREIRQFVGEMPSQTAPGESD